MKEKEIEKKVGDYATRRGCFHCKFKSENNRAVPDRLFITPGGKTFYMEFKAPGKYLTRAQFKKHLRMYAPKTPIFEIDNVAGGEAIINMMLAADDYD